MPAKLLLSVPPLLPGRCLRQVMEYAVTHYDVAYVLKTDDDAFINVAPMVEQLKLLCQNPGCQK